MKIFKFSLLLVAAVLYLATATAQYDTCFIERRQCKDDNIYAGYKLVIHYGKDTAKYWDYNLGFLYRINDRVKLNLIGMLLSYRDDTALCCLKVAHYSFNGNEGCRGQVEDVDRYPLQIDALFIINRLCWPKLMELYSCSPILFDTVTKKSINYDPEKIKIVFDEYNTWYKECVSKGVIARYFPFNKGRYKWDGGREGITKENN